jgi:hypothetical protein
MPPRGHFFYTIQPRVAQGGQVARFQAFRFGTCLFSYDVTCALYPKPISSGRTTLIKLKATQKPLCAIMVGYSGPMVELHALEPEFYRG